MTTDLSTKTAPKNYKRALVFASCDPFTRGHEALVRAASDIAEEVVLSIMTDPTRPYALTEQQRCDLAGFCLLGSGLPVKVTRPPDAKGQRVLHELVRNRCDVVVRAARPGEEWREQERYRTETTGFSWLVDRWVIVEPEGSHSALRVSGSAVRGAVAAGGWVSPNACSRRSQVSVRSAIRKEKRIGLLCSEADFESTVTACARQAALSGRVPTVRGVRWTDVLKACGSPIPEGMSGVDLLLLGAYSFDWGRGVNLVWIDEGCITQVGLEAGLALGGWDTFVFPSFLGSVADAMTGCGEANFEVVKLGDEKRVLDRISVLS